MPVVNLIFTSLAGIDKKTFLKLCKNLLSKLTPVEKRTIMRFGEDKKTIEDNECTFVPQTNISKS